MFQKCARLLSQCAMKLCSLRVDSFSSLLFYSSGDSTLNADSVLDVAMTVDGSWRKCGFSSIYGFVSVSVISVDSGLTWKVMKFSARGKTNKYCTWG